jgi:hypothetical protein
MAYVVTASVEFAANRVTFSLLSKASGFDKVAIKIYATLRQHCRNSLGNFDFQDLFNILQINHK